jgi:hypothetical protein
MFFGFINFYCRFIARYLYIISNIINMLISIKKDKKLGLFYWTNAAKKSF